MINILFCGNSKVFDGILTCSLSILKRTETKEPFKFFVYTMDLQDLNENYKPISSAQISFLENVIKEYNSENSIEKIDVTDLYNKEFRGCPNEQCYCSPYTLLRLFADLVPGMPSKFLYLDADILANRDITLLYNIDVSNVEYAAANDHYGKYLINPRYINAGVLLFNMELCRKTEIFKKSRELIKTKKLIFADQSALIRSTTKKKLIAQKFNDQKFLHKWTVLRHFSQRLFYFPFPHIANIKQWDVINVHKVFKYFQFDDILLEYIYLREKFKREFHE
ncbi:glycosyltransferase [uncultured Treponema sp.]|uniref:glycosyltransferase n=1 Tax=uncultured Treponema sp. TaxID=162155 RepID=UPI0025E8F5DF|nr:glycosyltransferase [uncultured Treponema sp.]